MMANIESDMMEELGPVVVGSGGLAAGLDVGGLKFFSFYQIRLYGTNMAIKCTKRIIQLFK